MNKPTSRRKILTRELRHLSTKMNRLLQEASRLGFRVEVGVDSVPGWNVGTYSGPTGIKASVFGLCNNTLNVSVWVKNRLDGRESTTC